MKPRLQIYDIKEITIDYEGVSDALNKGCTRDNTLYRITGVCQVGDTVFFPMEEAAQQAKVKYLLAPFSGISRDKVQADIVTRWASGFATKGLIELSASFIGLFELEEDK